MDKDKRIKRELKRLTGIFAEIEENKKSFVLPKLSQLAWLTVTIEDLRKKVDAEGTVSEYDNGGGQTGTRVNPDVQTLAQDIKLSNDITKMLLQLVPAKAQVSKLQQLLNDDE